MRTMGKERPTNEEVELGGIDHYWHTLPGAPWFSGCRIYAEQVKHARPGAIFVELGAWKGRSTAFMAVEIANSGKDIKFYTVDHWSGTRSEGAQENDEDVRAGLLYDVFLDNIRQVKSYVCPIRSDSAQASQQFADYSIDFVYVDAEHTFSAVKRDIELWWPKLKVGGVLAGDDWCFFDEHCNEFGVKKPLRSSLGRVDLRSASKLASPTQTGNNGLYCGRL